MKKVLQETKKAQTSFNDRYGVDFDIEKFNGVINGTSKKGAKVDLDKEYREEFSRLYKKAFGSYVDNKLSRSLDFGVMMTDFEKDLIAPYSDVLKSKGKKAPSPYGGWTVNTYLKAVKDYLDELPDSKRDFAESRYRARDLRIRDMRAFSDKVITNGDASPEKLSTLYCYYSALSRVNSERSRSWLSVLGSVFRHFAEQRYMDTLKAYLEEKTGGPLSLETNEAFMAVHVASCSDTIGRAAISVGIALDRSSRENPTAGVKEHVVIDAESLNGTSTPKTQKLVHKNTVNRENREIK